MTLYRYIFFKDLPGLIVRANLGGVMQLQDRPEHMARCQQTNTYHTRHICTLAAQDNVWGYNKQISRRSTSATDTTVLLIVSVLHREYINNFVCKRLQLFLTYTVPIISSGETSLSQHINTQLAKNQPKMPKMYLSLKI